MYMTKYVTYTLIAGELTLLAQTLGARAYTV